MLVSCDKLCMTTHRLITTKTGPGVAMAKDQLTSVRIVIRTGLWNVAPEGAVAQQAVEQRRKNQLVEATHLKSRTGRKSFVGCRRRLRTRPATWTDMSRTRTKQNVCYRYVMLEPGRKNCDNWDTLQPRWTVLESDHANNLRGTTPTGSKNLHLATDPKTAAIPDRLQGRQPVVLINLNLARRKTWARAATTAEVLVT